MQSLEIFENLEVSVSYFENLHECDIWKNQLDIYWTRPTLTLQPTSQNNPRQPPAHALAPKPTVRAHQRLTAPAQARPHRRFRPRRSPFSRPAPTVFCAPPRLILYESHRLGQVALRFPPREPARPATPRNSAHRAVVSSSVATSSHWRRQIRAPHSR
jgi:hypothetical protein